MSKQRLQRWLWAYLFVLPNVTLFLVFIVYPIFATLWVSFTRFSFTSSTYVGLRNYLNVLQDPLWWTSVQNTSVFAFGVVPANIVLAFFVATLILRLKSNKLQTFFKSAVYLPGVTSGIVMGLVWLWIFYPGPQGLLNYALSVVGLSPLNWLADAGLALWSLVIMSVIGHQGAGVILYCASIGGIPFDLYESADMDGATWLQKSIYITWPLVKPVTFYLFITGLASAFQVFVQPYVMTQGGPVNRTLTVVYLLYIKAFESFNFGEAAAMSFLLAIVVFGLAYINHQFFATDVEY